MSDINIGISADIKQYQLAMAKIRQYTQVSMTQVQKITQNTTNYIQQAGASITEGFVTKWANATAAIRNSGRIELASRLTENNLNAHAEELGAKEFFYFFRWDASSEPEAGDGNLSFTFTYKGAVQG